MINLLLFYEFFKIGLFAIGGGYATIPFLLRLTQVYHWFTQEELTNMIAISNITPGPVGINMATYTGFMTNGVAGSIISTAGIITPPFILTILTICFIEKFKNSSLIKTTFETLRPTSCALLSFVMLQFVLKDILPDGKLNPKALAITTVLFAVYPFIKKRPSLIILTGAFLGILSGVL